MKPQGLPTKTAGTALLVLILAPWANTSFARSQADQPNDRRVLPDLQYYLPVFADVDGDSNDEGQVYIAPDSVSSEPPSASLEVAVGKHLVIAGSNGRRDLGLYLSYLRERGPPL